MTRRSRNRLELQVQPIQQEHTENQAILFPGRRQLVLMGDLPRPTEHAPQLCSFPEAQCAFRSSLLLPEVEPEPGFSCSFPPGKQALGSRRVLSMFIPGGILHRVALQEYQTSNLWLERLLACAQHHGQGLRLLHLCCRFSWPIWL